MKHVVTVFSILLWQDALSQSYFSIFLGLFLWFWLLIRVFFFFQNYEFTGYLTFDLIHLLQFQCPEPSSSIIDEFATYTCIKRIRYLRPNQLLILTHHFFHLYLFSLSWLLMYLAILRSRKHLNTNLAVMHRSSSLVKYFLFSRFNLTLCIMLITSIATQQVHWKRGSDTQQAADPEKLFIADQLPNIFL